MKVVNRKEFLKLPEGTFYCKGNRWFFDGFYIKGESLIHSEDGPNDWVYLDFRWSDGKDSGESINILEESLETGSSFECCKSWGRDGCFDPDELFMVFETPDLFFLRDMLKETLDGPQDASHCP